MLTRREKNLPSQGRDGLFESCGSVGSIIEWLSNKSGGALDALRRWD
jgi:hypothetical protein